ncbi:hypothetical protein H2200_001877 [Cladophialophora chaetospira]|uniref:C2H2-type domain-containing protein n=1 Tax=Cladophialophora chaetospira TaxID=386627 RepID=A0AA38XMK5_9EURO|nr:hypothetical protein H2200_001877 [Cladophialophora chaetospira]
MDARKDEQQDLKSNDRIVKWVEQNDDNETATSSTIVHHEGTETGLISDLHRDCLYSIRFLMRALRNCNDCEVGPDEKAQLGHCYGTLNLWGDVLREGKLEASLRIVPAWRLTIVESLVKIAEALLLACRTPSPGSKIVECQDHQDHLSSLEVLIEKASDVLLPLDSDVPRPQDDIPPDVEGSEADSADEDSEAIPIAAQQTPWAKALLRALTFRTKLLMELLPTLQQILMSTERAEHQPRMRQQHKSRVSEVAQQWVRQVFDKFPKADSLLAERLGRVNAQRYDELRRLKTRKDTSPDLSDERPGNFIDSFEDSSPAQALFRAPTTIYHDSGLGTSIVTPSNIPLSDASYSSFASSVADGTSRRVPKTPDAVAQGTPFACGICGHKLSTIRSRTHWKAHVFSDIKPYICTSNDCKEQFTVFPTRKLWAAHEAKCHRWSIEFACHVCHKQLGTAELLLDHLRDRHPWEVIKGERRAWAVSRAKKIVSRPAQEERCPLCHKDGWQVQKAFVKHLGKHMEDMALLALPPNDDSEDGQEAEDSHDEDSRASSTRRQEAESKPQDPQEEEDWNLEPMHYFVPGEDIDVTVFVEYISRFVDPGAKITSCRHPTKEYGSGLNVASTKDALDKQSLLNIVKDSKAWDLETQTREYRRKPYPFCDSNTFRRREQRLYSTSSQPP